MPHVDNTPQQTLKTIPPEQVQRLVTSLYELHSWGKPQTDRECQERITLFFEYCEKTGLKPGVELLAFALGISRTTLYSWSHGVGCSLERQDMILSARQLILSLLEQLLLSSKVSPVGPIFMLKCMGWSEQHSFDSMPYTEVRNPLTANQLPKLDDTGTDGGYDGESDIEFLTPGFFDQE